MIQVTANVTQRDIERARAGLTSDRCPIEVALLRKGFDALVTSRSLSIWRNNRIVARTEAPPEVSKFVDQFDHDDPVEPQQFPLEFTEFD